MYFDWCRGDLEVIHCIENTFDTYVAGQLGADGEYYCIYQRYSDNSCYAIPRSAQSAIDALKTCELFVLSEDEEQYVFGNKVRGMTHTEEDLWNRDMLNLPVDIFGNVGVITEKMQLF